MLLTHNASLLQKSTRKVHMQLFTSNVRCI